MRYVWGALIFDRRTELGMSLADIANKAGIPLSTVKKMEHPDANPCVRALEAVLNALQYDLEVLDANGFMPAPMATVDKRHTEVQNSGGAYTA